MLDWIFQWNMVLNMGLEHGTGTWDWNMGLEHGTGQKMQGIHCY